MSDTDLNILYYRDPAVKMKAQSVIHIKRTGFKRLSQDSDNLGFTVPINNSQIISIIKLKMLTVAKRIMVINFQTLYFQNTKLQYIHVI